MAETIPDEVLAALREARSEGWYEEGPGWAIIDAWLASDLTTPYKAMTVHYPEADTLEYVQRDEPTYAQPVAAGVDVLRTMETCEPIGWRIYGWSKIAPAVDMADWQPIETAPSDDTHILVHFVGAGAIVAYRHPEQGDAYVRYLGYGKSHFWPTIHEDHATHWMPLPAPPAAVKD